MLFIFYINNSIKQAGNNEFDSPTKQYVDEINQLDIRRIQRFMDLTSKRFEFMEDTTLWYASKEDEFKPDRVAFVKRNFEECFGHSLDYLTITNLVARSSKLAEWYAGVVEAYILEVDVPQYFKDLIDPEDYKELSVKVKEYNNLNKSKSKELNDLSNDYKLKVSKINNKYESKFNNVQSDPLVKVLTLSSDLLPLKLQLMIEKYTASEDSDARTKALYAREMLIRYKVELLEEAAKGADIDTIIEENRLKF